MKTSINEGGVRRVQKNDRTQNVQFEEQRSSNRNGATLAYVEVESRRRPFTAAIPARIELFQAHIISSMQEAREPYIVRI